MKVRSQGHRRCLQMVAVAITLTKEQLLFLDQQTLRCLVTDLQFPLGNRLTPAPPLPAHVCLAPWSWLHLHEWTLLTSEVIHLHGNSRWTMV